ncbi:MULTISPECIES: hypothetical protein [Pseudomonas]|uniref:hypothetical protein n=2 Tax=Pseudomonas TaxID=286 RepID=UPI000CD4B47B|nr:MULTISPECIES: hypothetical protein [Pseudomonas]RBH60011.1 hypothetical protein C3F00_002790 [Pseudomonas sp. MWU13-2860]
MNMNIANWRDAAGQHCPGLPALFEGQRQVANYGAFAALVRYRADGAPLYLSDRVDPTALRPWLKAGANDPFVP